MSTSSYAVVANLMLVALTGIILVSPVHVTSVVKNGMGAGIAALILLIALATDAWFFALCLLCLLCILIKLHVIVLTGYTKEERFTVAKKCAATNKGPAAHPVRVPMGPEPVNDRELVMPMSNEREKRMRRRLRYYDDSSSSMDACGSCASDSSGGGSSGYDEEIVYETTGKPCYEHYMDDDYSEASSHHDDGAHEVAIEPFIDNARFASSSLDASDFNKSNDDPFRPLNAFRIDHRQKDSHVAGVIPRGR
jgi:hypothetical protein